MPSVFLVLRQVDGPLWCVVRRNTRDGRFDSRVVTARPFEAALAAALMTAKAEYLRIAIRPTGEEMRRFDPEHDTKERHG